jgi:nicotinate-nucleotide adenylyltransferase
MRHGFPLAVPGQVVGLLGGSFDPAHAGHVHVTREALRRFGLDRVWWLVSPGNPLKPRGPAPLAQRMERARRLMRHPRVEVTDIEARLGLRYTAQTIRRLQRLYPGVRFVWLMGADNLAQLHRWEDWRDIMERVPVGVIARPDGRLPARVSPAARAYGAARVPAAQARRLGRMMPPAWAFVEVPLHPASSTAIRAGGGWLSA